jgi:hypothetical protein
MGASFILQNILAALLPVAVDGVKGVIGKFSGEVRPTNIDEQIKLDGSQVEKLKALATLDNPYGTPSQWVVDLRASFRYLAAAIVIVAGLGVQLVPTVDLTIRLAGLEFSAMAFSFIFGDRVYLNLKK